LIRVALVTEEWPGAGPSGGIGVAFKCLAKVLASLGYSVDLYFLPRSPDFIFPKEDIVGLSNLIIVDPSKYLWNVNLPQSASYAVFQSLSQEQKKNDLVYDYIHFPDFHGLAFYTTEAKRCGMLDGRTKIVVQLHGLTRWTLECNKQMPASPEVLKTMFIEEESVANCDFVIAPSQYFREWYQSNIDSQRQIAVLANNYSTTLANRRYLPGQNFTDLVITGRHEARKGMANLYETLSMMSKNGELANLKVHFLGRLIVENNRSSLIEFARASQNWNFLWELHTDLDQQGLSQYIEELENPLIIVPSEIENSPYACIEPLEIGLQVVYSQLGGAKELLKPKKELRNFNNIPGDLKQTINHYLESGYVSYELSQDAALRMSQWDAWHRNNKAKSEAKKHSGKEKESLVSIVITHFNRPQKLLAAIYSARVQDYANTEIVVIDDGSSIETQNSDSYLEAKKLVRNIGGKFVEQENAYLGAARNTGIEESKGEYLVFLDDDDLLLPDAISRLMDACLNAKSEIAIAIPLHLEEINRSEHEFSVNPGKLKVSFLPTRGPKYLGLIENVFGTATCMFSRKILKEISGYTEIQKVGHEDFELLVKLHLKDVTSVVVPQPTFVYESKVDSMINSQSPKRNFLRSSGPILETSNMNLDLRTFLAMVSGKYADEHTQNRNNWISSITSNPTFHSLNNAQSQSEVIEALKQYYSESDNPYAIVNMILSRTKVKGKSKTNSIAFPQNRKGNQPENEFNPFLGFLMELESLDFTEIWKPYKDIMDRYLENSYLRVRCQEKLLEVLFSTKGATVNWEECVNSLKEIHASIKNTDADQFFLASLDWRIGKLDTEIRKLIVSESIRYVESYKDLKDLTDTSDEIGFFRHYVDFGLVEKRIGFSWVEKFLVQAKIDKKDLIVKINKQLKKN
jgi:glycosyltransferase involved in cell wall biosynthesis